MRNVKLIVNNNLLLKLFCSIFFQEIRTIYLNGDQNWPTLK